MTVRAATAAMVLSCIAAAARAQAPQCARPSAKILGAQTTFIGQNLRPFHAAYSGPMSLIDTGDHQLSQSYGVYSGACVTRSLAVYVDAEMVRGAGISHASGVAAVTNGDVLRQGSVDLGQGPYIARAFARWTLPLGGLERDTVERAPDGMPGTVAAHRVEITAGRFAASDIFDLNRYANSTRTQFLDWVLFNNGPWDFAADTRGFSNGVAVAWFNRRWALRVASFQMPTLANGNTFDNDLANARGDNAELTFFGPRNAVVRLLAYENHARMGIYDDAIAIARAHGTTPDIVADDAPGRVKYGFGLNGEVPLADSGNTGVFARLGWNDGHTESFVFTEADRHASAGVQISGVRWRRPADVFGVAIVAEGLSGPHRAYLAAGGLGFLLGDGALSYGPESVFETYYDIAIGPYVVVAPDAIVIVNPGYNRVRGPAQVYTLRARVAW